MQPCLANLEFPPPPSDLPPPPEEFNESSDLLDSYIPPDTKKTTSSPPSTARRIGDDVDVLDGNDVSNLEPSVEEASSRFGVSLKKREPSVESCGSMKESYDLRDKSPHRMNLSPNQEGRSPVSCSSDVPTVGSPLEAPNSERGRN